MDEQFQPYRLPVQDRIGRFVERCFQFGKRAALAFGLAVMAAIAIGALATDNGLVQLFVTVVAAIALWGPFLIALLWGEKTFCRQAAVAPETVAAAADESDKPWLRLAFSAPYQRVRIVGLRQSIARSRVRLSNAKLDPEAVDLLVLIDRRLPDLIDRELDALPPNDGERRDKLDALVNLIDQFARHCSRRGADDSLAHEREAEILRRRFEERLAPSPFESQ